MKHPEPQRHRFAIHIGGSIPAGMDSIYDEQAV